MTGEKIITVENMTAGFAIIWGAFVANPSNSMFARNPTLYGPMLLIVPYEAFWGLLFIVTGFVAIIFTISQRPEMAALLLSVLYIFFGGLYFVGDVASPAWALYGLIAVCNFIHYKGIKWRRLN